MAFFSFGWGAHPSPLCKKEIPEITLKNLSPPYKDYDYFQNHEFFPFEDRTSSFSLVNAWWLAETSSLVYADEAFVEEVLDQLGLQLQKVIDRAGTQCFIAANNRFAIVAFRGSQIWKRQEGYDPRQVIEDIKINVDIHMSDWVRGGRVHSGFKEALDAVWDEMVAEVSRLEEKGLTVWLTGHSQGAALATLAADRLPAVQGLYTFGSPRVGDRGFQAGFRPKAFRIVNGNDIVASVPPEGSYRHVGELKVLVQQEAAADRPDPAAAPGDPPCTHEPAASVGGNKFSSGMLIPRSVRDHVPLLYAIGLWNDLVDSLGSAVFALQLEPLVLCTAAGKLRE